MYVPHIPGYNEVFTHVSHAAAAVAAAAASASAAAAAAASASVAAVINNTTLFSTLGLLLILFPSCPDV